jgi:N-acetylmuramoyl-L-alanine amidase
LALSLSVAIPSSLAAAAANSVKREAAGSQFAKAEQLRAALNAKAPDKRTLADYKKVLGSYQRVYLITPHAVGVPDALFAVAELNTEMGDHFGQSYYQAAVDSYSFLIREYPASKHVQDAMLRVAKLQKDQLGDAASATKSYRDFQKKFPHSTYKREVQEALAELALEKSAEVGGTQSKNSLPGGLTEAPAAVGRKVSSGGEASHSTGVPRVQKIRATVTPDSTEIVIDLEDSVQYSSGRIANPDRIYFDLHSARLTPSLARENLRVTGDLLTKIRVAQNQNGVVRVVLDVSNVKDYSASLVKNPTRLMVELYGANSAPGTVETAQANRPVKPSVDTIPVDSSHENRDTTEAGKPGPTVLAGAATPDAPVATPAATPKSDTASTRTARAKSGKFGSSSKPELVQPASSPRPTRDGQSTLTRALGLKIGRIVIDAGHGGHDTGTIGPTGLMEKDLCLDVALRLGKIIQQKLPGADIVYTRSDDTFVPLEERTHIANEAQADLFISIHANSSPDHGARGVETYYLNLKGSPEAMEVAARENSASLENIHELQDMVKKIARTEKIDESKELAGDIQDSLSKRIQRTAKPVRNRGVRQAPFVVLIGADMPSILTEISFLSNPADEQLLKKPEHRQRVAEGLYQGVADYLKSLNSMNFNASGKAPRPPVLAAVEQSRNQK